MDAYEKIRAALEQEPGASRGQALAALAELERAAAEPVAWQMRWRNAAWVPIRKEEFDSRHIEPDSREEYRALYAAPPAPAAEIREVVVTDELAARVFSHWADAPFRTNSQDDDITMPMLGRVLIAAVRAELGPALGLVELKEPTPEECERISDIYHHVSFGGDLGARLGREMFDACRAVMWPKEGL